MGIHPDMAGGRTGGTYEKNPVYFLAEEPLEVVIQEAVD
jgi:hypothetical protein